MQVLFRRRPLHPRVRFNFPPIGDYLMDGTLRRPDGQMPWGNARSVSAFPEPARAVAELPAYNPSWSPRRTAGG